MLLVTHDAFQLVTGISKGITEEKTARYRKDAETYDLPTLLSGNLIADVRAFNIPPVEWAEDIEFSTGAYSTYGGIYYKALQDITSSGTITDASATPLSDSEIEVTWEASEGSAAGVIPGTDATAWEPDYKATLRYNHLPEFLIWSAYKRLLIEHGRNVTEAGLTTPNDPEGTYQQTSDTSRAVLIASARDKANFHKGQILAFLNKYELITRNSCEPVRRAGNGRIAAI